MRSTASEVGMVLISRPVQGLRNSKRDLFRERSEMSYGNRNQSRLQFDDRLEFGRGYKVETTRGSSWATSVPY